MAITANPLFDNAELSLVAYADFPEIITPATGSTLNFQNKLRQAGMTELQAKMFAARWPDIISSHTDLTTGLSVTVFRNGSDICVAIRGTVPTDFNDLWADLQLGTGEAVDQYAALKTYFYSLKTSGAITVADNVTVAGHSLGGFLAQVLTVDCAGDIDNTYTYNAPGIGGVSLDIFGSTGSVPVSSITNIQGDGFSSIANVGISVGTDKEIQIENTALFPPDDHSIKKLTDSLAVYNTLWQLDDSLTVETFNSLFKSSSNEEDASLENTINPLQKLFGVTETVFTTNDREQLYAAIDALQGNPETPNATFNALAGHITLDTNADAASARTDFGAFLSLYNLTPFVLHCNDAAAETALQNANAALHADWQADQSLSDAERTFADQYLQDRTTAFGVLNTRNTLDNNETTPGIRYNDTVYFDYESEKEFFYDGGNDSINSAAYTNKAQIHFGGSGAESLTGGNKDDHLYGGAGGDTLTGGEGSDYLEGGADVDTLVGGQGADTLAGGAGADIYQFNLDEVGFDTIIDKDGGSISMGAFNLSGLTFKPSEQKSNIFTTEDNKDITLFYDTTAHTLQVLYKRTDNSFGSIRVEDFDKTSNNFGINLSDAVAPTAPKQSETYVVADGKLGTYTYHYNDEDPETVDGPVDVYLNRDRAATYSLINYSGSDENRLAEQALMLAKMPTLDKAVVYDATLYAPYLPAGYLGTMAFSGAQGNDLLKGTAEHNANKKWDVLLGLNGNDVMMGDGSTSPTAGGGDVLIGGRGSDQVYGGGGDDVLVAMDAPIVTTNHDYMDYLTMGYDAATYGSVHEALYKNGEIFLEGGGSIGVAIALEDENESNYLDGGDGNDLLDGASFKDTLIGGKGDDKIYGGAGQDFISGGDDNDIVWGDSLGYFNWQSGTLYETSANYLTPDMGPVGDAYGFAYFFKQNNGAAELRYNKDLHNGSDEQKKEYNALFNDVIDGGKGNDKIFGEIGDDIIYGGEGSDQLAGDRDTASDAWGNVNFLDAFQPLSARYHGNDVIDGGTGNDFVYGNGGDDLLYGGAGSDVIHGDEDQTNPGALAVAYHGKDTLIGGAGDDFLYGEGGEDVLDGGAGFDILDGGEGRDTYVFRRGDGMVVGGDSLRDSSGPLVLRFEGVNDLSSLRLVQYSNGGVKIYYSDVGDYVRLFASAFSNLQAIELGGMHYSASDLINATATDHADEITGTAYTEVLNGKDGNDTLNGGGGDDILNGGNGDDMFYNAWGNSTFNGDAGDDWFITGIGNEILDGGAGSDTFVISAGGGNDSIINSDISDVIELDASFTPNNTYIMRDADDCLIQLKGSNDAIRIAGTNGVNTIRFMDGSNEIWTLDSTISLNRNDHQDNFFTIASSNSSSGGLKDALWFTPETLLENDGLDDGIWEVVEIHVISGVADIQYPAANGSYYFGEFWGQKIFAAVLQPSGAQAAFEYFIRQRDGSGGYTGPAYRGSFHVSFEDKDILTGSEDSEMMNGVDASEGIIFDGKAGDDTFTGSWNADRVIHRAGDGNDLLIMQKGGGWEEDSLVLIGASSESDVSFAQDNHDLLVTLQGETTRIQDYTWMASGALASIELFADETAYTNNQALKVWTPDDLLDANFNLLVQAMAGWGAPPVGEAPITILPNTSLALALAVEG